MFGLLKALMAYSNNFMTDMLVNAIGARHSSSGSTHKNGLYALNDFVRRQSPVSKGFHFKNASGLSHENKMTARDVTRFLAAYSRKSKNFPLFLASFPRAGAEGSLKSRFKDSKSQKYAPMIWAKSGTHLKPLTCGLAGYITHPREGLLVFAVFQNEIKGSKKPNIFNSRRSVEIGMVQFLESLN